MSDVTRILSQIEQGDPQAAEKLLPLIYNELRRLAAAKLAHEKPGKTLQATALVHEAYVRLASEGDTEGGDFEGGNWNSRVAVAWAHVTSLHRTLLVLLCPLFLAVATTGARGADEKQERPWRVLLVHSFGSSAPPFTTHSTAFESTLKRELGTAVDLDEVSLDMARYAQPDMEEAFAEFLGKRMSEWQPDLVVPIGSPAGKFVAKFRDKLFPQTPVIYSGMDRRTLPADAFAKNATFVGENFDLQGLVADILQLDPETNQVVVILGATSLERFWTAAFQEAFEPFTGRVKFTWVNDLSFDQMLDLVSKLPPHSFVLLGLFMRDASGVTYNEDDALVRLHAVSRAPISGLYQHQMGLGIVGGRLYQGELEGMESARVAARILRGEQASSFAPMYIGTRPPTYDWRELMRWGISESRLPPGSVVMFRQPTVWERYRWQMVGTVALIATQAVLISALLIQRRRRNLAQQAQKKSQAEVQQILALLRELTGKLLGAQEMERRRIARELHDDLGQSLALLSVELDLLQQRPPQDPTQLAERVAKLSSRVKQLSSSIHDLSHQLHPMKLEQLGLVAAIRGLCNELSESHGLAIEFLHDEPPDSVPPEIALCLYRIAQEALQNIIKHSRAGHATIELRRSGGQFCLRVRDDGIGFDPNTVVKQGGLGLASMRERMRLVNGEITIHGNAPHGTQIDARVPLGTGGIAAAASQDGFALATDTGGMH